MGTMGFRLVMADVSEAIHAASYFKVYKTIGGDGFIVPWIIPHFLGDHFWEDADVLVVLHGRAKVEVFDVDAKVAGTFVGIGYGAIYVELGIEHRDRSLEIGRAS